MSKLKTIADVRQAAEAIKVLEQAQRWREAFEASEMPEIVFGTIGVRGIDDYIRWPDEELALPRDCAVELMTWLEEFARRALADLGVEG